ncbi:hypothetical protein SLE2022_357460 [Rubroshorea leprosula]
MLPTAKKVEVLEAIPPFLGAWKGRFKRHLQKLLGLCFSCEVKFQASFSTTPVFRTTVSIPSLCAINYCLFLFYGIISVLCMFNFTILFLRNEEQAACS